MSFLTKFTSHLVISITAALGSFSLLIFLFFLFTGSFHFIDLRLDDITLHIWNLFLSLLFFLQHSVMIRKSFRSSISNILPAHYHGVLYTIASSVVLLCVILFWQESQNILISIQGLIRFLLRFLFLLSIFGIFWSVRALDSFDTFGLKPILTQLREKGEPLNLFVVRGPYRWVRHPIYFFVLIFIWSHPDVTVDRLLFNLCWTIWIFIGTTLEEKDLVNQFGKIYRDYQGKVPMLIPTRIKPLIKSLP